LLSLTSPSLSPSAARLRAEARLQQRLAADAHRDDADDAAFFARLHDGFHRERARRRLDGIIYTRQLTEWNALRDRRAQDLARVQALRASLGDAAEAEAGSSFIASQLAVAPLPPPPRKPKQRLFLEALARPRPARGSCPQADGPQPGDALLSGGLYVPGALYDSLLGFQQQGLQWLWQLHRACKGGILADEMGLGKHNIT
jgi:SNF2 family DNA or RNA helicase